MTRRPLIALIALTLFTGCVPILTCYQDAIRNYTNSSFDITWKKIIVYEPGYPRSHAIFVFYRDGGIWGQDYNYEPRYLREVTVNSSALEIARAFDDRAKIAKFE